MTPPTVPALVPAVVTHHRRGEVEHRLRHRVYQWLIDADAPPAVGWWLRPFATFRPRDHIGDPSAGIGANIRAFAATDGLDLTDHRILMLANARVLGHVFDPLSVFWAIAPDGSVTCVVAEVHNTYGERHAYLLRPDDSGRSTTDKQFYVSPFYDVSGTYDLRFRLAPDDVTTQVVLRQCGEAVFTAAQSGHPEPYTPARLVRLVVTHPLMTWRVSALIRFHGIRLWLRRLPIVPRPHHTPQEGTR